MKMIDKLYVALMAWFSNVNALYISREPKEVLLKNAMVDEEGNVTDVTIPNDAMREKRNTEWKDGVMSAVPGMKNYYVDPFGLNFSTDDENRKIPNTGFRRPYGSMYIECVSPFMKGAACVGGHAKTQEYWENEDVSTTQNFSLATDTNRLWRPNANGEVFGVGGIGNPSGLGVHYNWGGNFSNGHIFKITSTPSEEGISAWLEITDRETLSKFVQTGRGSGETVTVRIRGWIYVEKGYLGFGNHVGYLGDIRLKEGHQNRFEAKEEWQFVDVQYKTTNASPLARAISIGTDFDVDLEAYFAAPSITVSNGNKAYIA